MTQASAGDLHLAQADAQNQVQLRQAPVSMPTVEQVVLLSRTTLMALSNALITNNYAVFRETGAPDFRNANSPERLAQIFGPLADRGLDLTLVALLAPEMKQVRLDQANRMVKFDGSFATRPVPVDFVLIYQEVAGYWRLFGISLDIDEKPAKPIGGIGRSTVGTKNAPGRRTDVPIPRSRPGRLQ